MNFSPYKWFESRKIRSQLIMYGFVVMLPVWLFLYLNIQEKNDTISSDDAIQQVAQSLLDSHYFEIIQQLTVLREQSGIVERAQAQNRAVPIPLTVSLETLNIRLTRLFFYPGLFEDQMLARIEEDWSRIIGQDLSAAKQSEAFARLIQLLGDNLTQHSDFILSRKYGEASLKQLDVLFFKLPRLIEDFGRIQGTVTDILASNAKLEMDERADLQGRLSSLSRYFSEVREHIDKHAKSSEYQTQINSSLLLMAEKIAWVTGNIRFDHSTDNNAKASRFFQNMTDLIFATNDLSSAALSMVITEIKKLKAETVAERNRIIAVISALIMLSLLVIYFVAKLTHDKIQKMA